MRGRSAAESLKWASLRTNADRFAQQMRPAWLAGNSRHERCLADAITTAGLPIERQRVIGEYGVDLADEASGLAVEVMSRALNTADVGYERQRLEYILDAGWFVLILDLTPRRPGVSYPALAEQIIAYAKITGSAHALRGQYGVLRGDGQPSAKERAYFPHRPCIVGPRCADHAARIDDRPR
jgi:very-short-patch-repair endonuclease